MTLQRLVAELKPLGIRKIGVLSKSDVDNGKTYVTVYFTSDTKVVFPYRLQNIHPLVLATDDDNQKVNSEQVKALKRSLIPDWDED